VGWRDALREGPHVVGVNQIATMLLVKALLESLERLDVAEAAFDEGFGKQGLRDSGQQSSTVPIPSERMPTSIQAI
jgi:hypothetical protein